MKEIGSHGVYKEESLEFIFTQQLYTDTYTVQLCANCMQHLEVKLMQKAG
jgi:hypothetical protein